MIQNVFIVFVVEVRLFGNRFEDAAVRCAGAGDRAGVLGFRREILRAAPALPGPADNRRVRAGPAAAEFDASALLSAGFCSSVLQDCCIIAAADNPPRASVFNESLLFINII